MTQQRRVISIVRSEQRQRDAVDADVVAAVDDVDPRSLTWNCSSPAVVVEVGEDPDADRRAVSERGEQRDRP